MTFKPILPLAIVATTLAACDSPPEQPDNAPQQATVAAPEPVLTPGPTATAAADGTALEPGEWTVTEDASGARAMFGVEETDATLAIACDSGRQLTFALQTDAEAESWRLDAGGEAARIDMTSDGNEVLPYLEAQLDPGLGIVYALGDPGQVFTLTSPAGERIQFPTHPGIRRVVSACS